MSVFSIILIVIWAMLILDGIYGLMKGHFFSEQDKVEKHEPNAYRKWIKISSVLLIICAILNIVWSVYDSFSGNSDWTYILFIVITVIICIAIISITYYKIVKAADRKAGIESDFDKILKEKNKKN